MLKSDVLKKAIDAQNVKKVESLVVIHDMKRKVTWHGGYLPLLYAVQSRQFKCAVAILKAGASIRYDGQDQLNDLLYNVAQSGSKMLLQMILDLDQTLINALDNYGLSPLHRAIRDNDEKALKVLLVHKANMEIVSALGITPLQLALEGKNVKMIEPLLIYGADMNHETEQGHPFHLAFCTLNKNIIDLFLNRRVSVNVRNRVGDTALHVYCKNSIKSDSEMVVTYLLQKGADVNAENNEKQTPLLYAVQNNLHITVLSFFLYKVDPELEGNKIAMRESIKQSSLMFNMFLRSGFLLSKSDMEDVHLLAGVVEHGHVETLRNALCHGIFVDTVVPWYSYQLTLLQFAAVAQQLDCLKLLLDSGADISITEEKRGLSSLLLAMHKKNEAKLKVVEELLDRGASLSEESNEGQTALHYAVVNDSETTLQYLLSHGADVDHRMKGGATALHCAAYYGRFKSISTLLEHGATVNATMSGNLTPLHVAVLASHPKTAVALMSFGADIDSKDEYGQTPLHMAVREQNYRIIISLLLRGANVFAKDKCEQTPYEIAYEKEAKGFSEHYEMHEKCRKNILDLFEDVYIDLEMDYYVFSRKEKDKNRNYFSGYALEGESTQLPIATIFERYINLCDCRRQILGMSMQEIDEFVAKLEVTRPKRCLCDLTITQEVMQLRYDKITDGITLHEFLTTGSKKMARHFVDKKIDKKSILEGFHRFGYYSMLKKQIEDVERWTLSWRAGCELNQYLEIRLPNEMIDHIMHYLSRQDLKNLLKVTVNYEEDLEVDELMEEGEFELEEANSQEYFDMLNNFDDERQDSDAVSSSSSSFTLGSDIDVEQYPVLQIGLDEFSSD